MNVVYTNDFIKSLKKVNDKIARKRLDVLIGKLEEAQSLSEIPNVKAIVNFPGRYRIRTGDYRLIVAYWTGEITILLIKYLKRNDNTYRKYN